MIHSLSLLLEYKEYKYKEVVSYILCYVPRVGKLFEWITELEIWENVTEWLLGAAWDKFPIQNELP